MVIIFEVIVKFGDLEEKTLLSPILYFRDTFGEIVGAKILAQNFYILRFLYFGEAVRDALMILMPDLKSQNIYFHIIFLAKRNILF